MNPNKLPDTEGYEKYLRGDYDLFETSVLKYIGWCVKIGLIMGVVNIIWKTCFGKFLFY